MELLILLLLLKREEYIINNNSRLLHLHRCEAATWTTILHLLKMDPTLESLYQLSPSDLHQKLHLTLEKSRALYNQLQSISIVSMLEQYKSRNIQCITVFDSDYPIALKQIYNPPWVLYAKGNCQLLLNNRMIAIVGTRNPTSYGLKMTEYFVESLVANKWVTVSGLAKGIDAKVHKSTLQKEGKTIGVLGSGFNHIYPKENNQLASDMINTSLLITEYPPERRPQKWHFPARNRIISGLSLGTVVIEAKEKSGSLITAELALQQNREVFAIPGPINSDYSIGTNLLIQEGAKLILHPQDIYSEFDQKII
ncbi:DNA-processing protein DprA [Bacillus sp. DJP31]|uniref:DNA-processing protein DprA n=1 Tax=Bacillus sp. DJP31 TaxID=3409789 RepID=UPI003BB6BBA7